MQSSVSTQQQPDHDWFLERVRREQAGLRAFIRSLGMRAEVVDDVAQQAFVVAFQKLQTFERGAVEFDNGAKPTLRVTIGDGRKRTAAFSKLRCRSILHRRGQPFRAEQ